MQGFNDRRHHPGARAGWGAWGCTCILHVAQRAQVLKAPVHSGSPAPLRLAPPYCSGVFFWSLLLSKCRVGIVPMLGKTRKTTT